MPVRIDKKEFRDCLGQFATGVTVITTLDPSGQPVGVTANSFNSVSLEPALVLWSLAKDSNSLEAFQQNEYFTINVLSHQQIEISNRFAQKGEDKFDSLAWLPGIKGIPLLEGCAARFQCRRYADYDGGDHRIFVGEVQALDHFGRDALLYYRGHYAVCHPHPDVDHPAQPAADMVILDEQNIDFWQSG